VSVDAIPRKRSTPRWTAGAAAVALLLGLWEVGGQTGVLGSEWPPLSTVVKFYGQPGNPSLLGTALATTVREAALGFLVGAAVATLAASVGSLVPWLRSPIESMSAALNSVPWIMLGPLLVLVLPQSVGPVAIAALAAFFYIFVAVSTGLTAAPAAHHDLLSVLGASRRSRFRQLQLPAALPEVVDGLRLAAPAALIGAIFGEWFGAQTGLGVLLITSMQNYRIDLLWAAALLGVVVSLLAYGGLSTLRWAVWRRFT
jgi:ABC-type nitrate/sulfonate/bicarbonate transport system permease component